MKVEWNRVTWYSKLAAVIVFVGTFAVAFWLGMLVQKATDYRELLPVAGDQAKPALIGGQTDAHGCLIAAGYSWCDAKQKCLRPWEEACNTR